MIAVSEGLESTRFAKNDSSKKAGMPHTDQLRWPPTNEA